MHNLWSYHQKVVALQTKEVSRSFSFVPVESFHTSTVSKAGGNFTAIGQDPQTAGRGADQRVAFQGSATGLPLFTIYVLANLLTERFQFMVYFVLLLISHTCIIRAAQRSRDTQAVFWASLILCFCLSALHAAAPRISWIMKAPFIYWSVCLYWPMLLPAMLFHMLQTFI